MKFASLNDLNLNPKKLTISAKH